MLKVKAKSGLCAEFWIRYVRYLVEADPENAKIAMQRAQQVHCKRDASLHLFAARFHERTGTPAAPENSSFIACPCRR